MRIEREVPFSGSFDLVVCGGGPSGIAAAVSASRLGLRTALIEKNHFFGGMGAGGYVVPLSGFFHQGVRVAGGIGYYYTCTDAGMQSLHYGPSVRLRELLERVKADRKRYAGDGAAISWNTNHPETCASLGLDFEDNA